MKFLIVLLAALLLAGTAHADTKNCSVIVGTVNPAESGATDSWINLVDSSLDTTQAAADAYIFPFAGRVSQLTARVDVAPGGTDTWDIYVSINGTTALTSVVACEILGTAVSCISSDSVSFERGSDVAILIDSDDGASDPTAAAELTVAFCVTKD